MVIEQIASIEGPELFLGRFLPHHPDSEKFRELVVEPTVPSVSRYVRAPGRLGSHRDLDLD